MELTLKKQRAPRFGGWEGKIWMSDDFDAPMEEFKEYTSLIAYQNIASGKSAVPVTVKNDYTTRALLRLGWHWPEVSGDYLRKFLAGIKGLGLFGV